jgi:hypothetical protein
MLTHYWPDVAAKVISGAEVITAMEKVICRATQSLVCQWNACIITHGGLFVMASTPSTRKKHEESSHFWTRGYMGTKTPNTVVTVNGFSTA